VASKAASLIDGAGAQDGIALIGGMSKIPAVREKLAGLTGRKMLALPIDAQSVAAFGAALLAQGRKNRDGRIVAEKRN
jgi:molecular chaperone DnaK (HSP70)